MQLRIDNCNSTIVEHEAEINRLLGLLSSSKDECSEWEREVSRLKAHNSAAPSKHRELLWWLG